MQSSYAPSPHSARQTAPQREWQTSGGGTLPPLRPTDSSLRLAAPAQRGTRSRSRTDRSARGAGGRACRAHRESGARRSLRFWYVSQHFAAHAQTAARAVLATDEELDIVPFLQGTEFIETGTLVRCMAALDLRGRTVVTMSFLEERSAEEIAKALQATAGNVRVLRHRAIAALRRCLDGASTIDDAVQMPPAKRRHQSTLRFPISFETLIAYWADDSPAPRASPSKCTRWAVRRAR